MDVQLLRHQADELDIQASQIEVDHPEQAAAIRFQAMGLREQAMMENQSQMHDFAEEREQRKEQLRQERADRLAA